MKQKARSYLFFNKDNFVKKLKKKNPKKAETKKESKKLKTKNF